MPNPPLARADLSVSARRIARVESRRRRRRLVGLASATALATALVISTSTAGSAAPVTPGGGFVDTVKPQTAVDVDTQAVELGVKFSVSKPGAIVGIEFYDTRLNTGPHIGTLWDATGKKLATVTFTDAGTTGWVSARFAAPIRIKAGTTYVASYTAPHGRYAADERYFREAVRSGNITFPRGAGVYQYGKGGFPTSNYNDSNYYVDVQFVADATSTPKPTASVTPKPTASASATPRPTASATATPKPSATATPKPTASATPKPTPTPTPSPTKPATSPTPTPAPTASSATLNLPREAWFGGPAYYAKFPNAKANGWTDPSFFPISVFLGKPAHAAALKAAGINTYMGAEHDGSAVSTMTSKGISVLAQQDEWTKAEVGTDRGVVGWLVSDECEMGLGGCESSTEAGRLAQQKAWADDLRSRNDGRFLHANFGNGVLGTYWAETTMDDQVALLDGSSVDKYAYTSPHVQGLLRDNPYWPKGKNPASAAAYGWLQDRMETFSGSAKPNWVFVETGMPYLTDTGRTTITGDQLEGAVWNSIINGASGIAYFQHNNNGTCGNYSILECGAERLAKVTAVNAQVRSLAPVLNTPSYVWNFGTGLDTNLKASGGSAYIFAMTDGGTGARTFRLPPDLAAATSVQVVDEGRTIAVTAGSFTDTFAAEHTHHIYRIVTTR